MPKLDKCHQKKSWFDEIKEIEEKNRSKTINKFPRELESFKKSFELVVEAYNSICKAASKKRGPIKNNQHIVALFITNRYIHSAICAFELFLKGYYNDGVIISRSMLEITLLCKHLDKSPEAAEFWMRGEYDKIRVSKLIKDFCASPDSKKNFWKVYSSISEIAHTSGFGSIISILQPKKKPYTFYIGLRPRFSSTYFKKYFALTGLNYLFLIFLRHIFKEETSRELKSQITKNARIYISNSSRHL